MPVKLSDDKERIGRFLANHQVGVLATADSKGQPHAATIYFTVDDRLNFYFVTKEDTTKSQNLRQNPQAALAIFEEAKDQATVQVVGKITALGESDKRVEEVFHEVVGTARATSKGGILPASQMPAGKYIVYELEPTRIRLAEFTPSNNWLDQLFDIEQE